MKRRINKKLAETDLLYFCREICGYNDVNEEVHGELAQRLTDYNGRSKLFLLPRGHLKSSIITIAFPLWLLVQDPNRTISITNYSQNLVRGFLREMKIHLVSPEFQKTWPGLVPPSRERTVWNATAFMLSRDLKSRTPSVTAMSIDENSAGHHFDIMVFDDIVNDQNVLTTESIAKIHSQWKTQQAIMNPPKDSDPICGMEVLVGTRWHYHDLYNTILTEHEEDYDCWVQMATECGTLDEGAKVIFPQKFTLEHLRKLRRKMGGWHFCTPGETPILMGDFSIKPIRNVRVGDEVVGYRPGKHRMGLVPSVVKDCGSLMGEVFEYSMESGRVVRCTDDHFWYSGRSGVDGHRKYSPIRIDGCKGLSSLQFIANPDQPDRSQSGWLSGFFDGEGSASNATTLTFAQCTGKNQPVIDLLRSELEIHKFDWSENLRLHEQEGWSDSILFQVKGGWHETLRFLQLTRPARGSEIIRQLYKHSSNLMRSDKVLSRRSLGVQATYWLETESENYVAWGYASKNSAQYMNKPVDSANAAFPSKLLRKFVDDPDKLIRQVPMGITMAVDPAWGTEGGEDRWGLVTIATDARMMHHVLEAWPMRMKPDAALKRIVQSVARFRPHRIVFENTGGQEYLRQHLIEKLAEADLVTSVMAGKHQNTKKEVRILRLIPYFEQHRIILHKDCVELYQELIEYPRSQWRDLVDALEMAVNNSLEPSGVGYLEDNEPLRNVPGTGNYELEKAREAFDHTSLRFGGGG